MELETVIKSHVPPSFLKFEGDDFEGSLGFELESEGGCFVLIGGH